LFVPDKFLIIAFASFFLKTQTGSRGSPLKPFQTFPISAKFFYAATLVIEEKINAFSCLILSGKEETYFLRERGYIQVATNFFFLPIFRTGWRLL